MEICKRFLLAIQVVHNTVFGFVIVKKLKKNHYTMYNKKTILMTCVRRKTGWMTSSIKIHNVYTCID